MMSNVMGNLRGTIAKQIFLSLGLFFSFSQLGAMCPQTVGAVTPGEGVWLLISRIGEATNVIESQLCLLSSGSGGACPALDCSFSFGQSDIGVGGIYTISVPGTYCMTQNATFNTGVAITVNSSDVTIDMKGHTLNGGNNSTVGIELGNGIQNVIVQNGTIEALGGALPNGVGIRDAVGHAATLKNITIQDMHFNSISSRAISLANGTIAPMTDSVLIQDSNAFDAGAIIVNGNGGIIRGCSVDETRMTGSGGIQVSGFSLTQPANYFVIEDCSSTGSFGQQAIGAFAGSGGQIQITSALDAIISNCVVQGVKAAGFIFTQCKNMLISDSIAQAILNDGYDVSLVMANATLTMERCVAQGCGRFGFYIQQNFFIGIGPLISTKLVDCIAQNNTSIGFFIENLGASFIPLSNIFLKRCCADGNILGFLFTGGSVNTLNMSQVVVEDCVAQGNVGGLLGFALFRGDGFALSFAGTPFTGGIIVARDFIFRDCVAQGNNGVGFSIGSSSGFDQLIAPSSGIMDVICQNCVADGNGRDGFSFAGTATQCQIFNCCSMNNTATGINNPANAPSIFIIGNTAFNNGFTDIAGVQDPTLIVSRTFPGAAAGATSWVNIIS
jgi:hypothetical protein